MKAAYSYLEKFATEPTELALVEDDLRTEIDRLRLTGVPPLEQGVRLRAHSALRLTSPQKSKGAVQRRENWSGSHPQNIVLPLDDSDEMASDFEVSMSFLESIEPRRIEEGLIAHDVQASEVVSFLSSLTNTGDARVFDYGSISNWIHRQSHKRLLQSWTVFVPCKANAVTTIKVADHKIGLTSRSKLKMQNSIGVLVDPKHESIDLEGGAEAYRLNNSYDTEAMRRARPTSRGLLLLYMLDPKSDSKSDGRERLVAGHRVAPPAVISVGLSLPYIPDDEARSVIVNEAFVDG